MKDLPFAKYDFWAYLSSGFLLLYVADYIFAAQIFERPQWTVVQTIVAISAAYVAGHLIAGLSSLIFERWLVNRLLGSPREILFGKAKASKVLRILIPGYFQPLPTPTRDAALAKSAAAGVDAPGEAMFWLAFAQAKESPVAMARIESFLNLYGFCRNVALVFLLSSAGLALRYLFASQTVDLWLSLAALLVALGMLVRYLKFLRHYAVEVLTQYAVGRSQSNR